MHCVDVMNKAVQEGHHFDVADAGEDQNISKIANWRANMIKGALRANASKAFEIEKVINTVFMLDWDAAVDSEFLKDLTKKGFSRIPVYYGAKERCFIVGVLMLKSLVQISIKDDDTPQTLGELALKGEIEIRDPIYVERQTDINEIMKQFQRGHLHQAVICDDPESLLTELAVFHKMIKATMKGDDDDEMQQDVDEDGNELEPIDPVAEYEDIKA